MGWIGCIRCEKFRCDFVTRTFAQVRPVLHWVFESQPNGPRCIQIVQNTPKHEFRVPWVGSGAFIAKNSDKTSWHELLHHFSPFCIDFCKATKRLQMHSNSTKQHQNMSLESHGVYRQNSNVTSWHELLHQLGSFWTECWSTTNCPKCTQTVRNTTKHEVTVQWGGSSGLLWKIPTRLHGTNFCTTSARFAPSFVR